MTVAGRLNASTYTLLSFRLLPIIKMPPPLPSNPSLMPLFDFTSNGRVGLVPMPTLPPVSAFNRREPFPRAKIDKFWLGAEPVA